MSLPRLVSLVALAPFVAPSAQEAKLLGQGAERGDVCGTSSVAVSADFVIQLEPGPTILTLRINENNAPQLEGQTFRIGPDAGTKFVQAVDLLTDGAPTSIRFDTDFSPGGGCGTTYHSEKAFFDFPGLTCPNGIDFGGSSIGGIGIFVEKVRFRPGSPQTTLRVDVVVSVYGHNPVCDPQQPIQASSALRGELAGFSDHDLRWRLWVEHAASVSDAVGDVLLVSRRPLELPLAAGQLLCDPSADALVLLKTSFAAGQVVELPIPAGFSGPETLHAQALVIEHGRFHLTNGLELNLPREQGQARER